MKEGRKDYKSETASKQKKKLCLGMSWQSSSREDPEVPVLGHCKAQALGLGGAWDPPGTGKH